MAAHLVGAGCSVLDNTGIARKGGAVTSDVRLAPASGDVDAARIADRAADVMLACDPVTAATPAVLAKIGRGRTQVVGSATALPTLNQRLALDGQLDSDSLQAALVVAAGTDRYASIDAAAIATRILGDAIYANMVMLGFAFQKALIPLPLEAIDEAIRVNGADVDANRRAFAWGRRAAREPLAVEQLLHAEDEVAETSLDDLVARRVAFLTAYQDAAYAARYRRLIECVRTADRQHGRGDGPLSWAAARGYFRLLAVKDEYEVARLYIDSAFARALARQFSGDVKLRYHLAPPLLTRPDPATGRIRKQTYGPWVGKLFRLLAAMKGLRGTWLDPFGHTRERRMERALIAEYEATIDTVLGGLDHGNYDIAVELAALPEQMRGYGHVKAANVASAKARQAQLLASFGARTAQAA
jgi:indolepyruvate ferredoxin oxidoreductase